MKKLLGVAFGFTILGLFICSLAFANGNVKGTVRDNNNGTEGQVLLHSGEVQGRYNDVGTWVDSDFLQGEDGEDGQDGEQGDKGDTGERGRRGITGETGAIGEQGEQGEQGEKGDEGKKGDKGNRGLQGLRGKGLEDRYEAILEGRILDTRKTTWSIYAGNDFNNNVQIYGVKCTIKFGRSYEERRLDELEKKLKKAGLID